MHPPNIATGRASASLPAPAAETLRAPAPTRPRTGSSCPASPGWLQLGLRGGREVALVLVVVLALVARDRVLELPHAGADRPAHLGQALRTEDDQGDDEDDHELHRPDIRHAATIAPV